MLGRLLSLTLLLWAASASAAPPQWSTYLGGEGAGQEGAPGHGFFSVKYTETLQALGVVSAELHTDTVKLEWSGLPLGANYTAGARATAEVGFANLMPDYFLDGTRRQSRGFFSSYLQGQTWIKGGLVPHLWGTLELGGRRWFAHDGPGTDPAFVLPSETWSLEPRLHLTWWDLAHDAAWSDPHRLYPRLEGFAFGVSLGLDWFADADPWGAMDPDAFTPPDPRNHPDQLQWMAYQWLRAGLPVGDELRVEVVQSAGHRTGADDRTRWPAGGLTPYVAPLAGAFWAYFHTASFVSVVMNVRHAVSDAVEWGPFVTTLDLVDPTRRGLGDRHTLWGAGLSMDWRAGPWQVDLRAGYSLNLGDVAPAARPWSVLFNVGWGR